MSTHTSHDSGRAVGEGDGPAKDDAGDEPTDAAALDIEQPEALISYLRHGGWIGSSEHVSTEVLYGGVSNRTVLVKREGGDAWVLKQALPKLRVAVDWFSDPARIHREALGLRWLTETVPTQALAAFIFEDHDQHVLAMRAVPEPHKNWKNMLMAGRVDRDHVAQFGRLLGTIHRAGTERRDEVARLFDDRSFFESLRIEPYYGYTASQVPEAASFLHALIEETHETRLTIVHGDYSPKNILIYGGTCILLDHEVIYFGDPAFDIGFSLTHLLSKAHHLLMHRSTFIEAAALYWHTYSEVVDGVAWAARLEGRAVRHTLACLLARVAGRSPLEYLDPLERRRQRAVVLLLLARIPSSIPELITLYRQLISQDSAGV